MHIEKTTFCTFPWEMYSVDSGFGWWRPCPRIDYQTLDDTKFFNHDRLVELRKNLREGVKDTLCNRCWKDEERGVKSYRQVLAQDMRPENYQTDYLSVPKIFEVKFSNLCNLKCVFCTNKCSSLWEAENPIEKSEYGQIHGDAVGRDLLRYFQDNYQEIQTIQIFGGEPVLHPEFAELVGILANAPASFAKKELSFSTNLFFTKDRRAKFLNQLEEVLGAGHKLYLRISIDGVAEQGEYLRTGLKWNVFHENLMALRDVLRRHSNLGRIKCNIALNILNLTSLDIIMKYLTDNELEWVEPHYNYVGKPEKFMMQSYGERLQKAVTLISEQDFHGYEKYKTHVLRLISSMVHLSPDLRAIDECQEWLRTYDQKTGKKFLELFPRNEFMFERCT